MRQRHPAGERLFVDYAGHTIDVIDPETGEVRVAQLLVATLGASNYTYAEVTWSQSLPDWITSHERAFAFFGGVPAQVVPDNLKSGVTRACFYDPEINRTYADLAVHYDTAAVPARPYKPKDKAKVAWAFRQDSLQNGRGPTQARPRSGLPTGWAKYRTDNARARPTVATRDRFPRRVRQVAEPQKAVGIARLLGPLQRRSRSNVCGAASIKSTECKWRAAAPDKTLNRQSLPPVPSRLRPTSGVVFQDR